MSRISRTPMESNGLEPGTQEQGVAAASSSTDLEPGQWVGEYVVTRKLGEGGFGAVYEALHPVIGKRAAVKVLHAQYSSDERVASRFAAEARAVNQIRHKSIVDIFSFGELSDGRQYYVMELLEGVPLDVYLEHAQRLDLSEALTILSEIARALQAAHEAGIAHRDLKPENVFLELDPEGMVHPKILDFGMAKLLAPGALPVHKTRSGTPIGSPRYMSPEQCRGAEVDPRTDVYAFGCMAFRMLAGVPPFDASTALELMMAHVSAPPVPLSSMGPDHGPAVDECLLKMLEKVPENRPQTITDAFNALRHAATASDPEFALPAGIEASPLLRRLASDRAQATSESIDISKLKRTPTKSQDATLGGSRSWAWPVASIALAGILFLALNNYTAHRSAPLPSPPAQQSAHTAIEATTALAELPPTATPAATVAVTVNTQPPRAELYLNEKRIGTSPGPVLLPLSDEAISLQVRASGFHAQSVTFIPKGDQTLRVVMVPLKFRASGNTPRDLENPY